MRPGSFAVAAADDADSIGIPMRLEDFFQALFAAIRVEGAEFIDVRGDQHQRRFSHVAEWLSQHPEEAERIGICFFPSPYNGRYAEFDAELLNSQAGLLGARNPFYPGIHLQFSSHRAKEILEARPAEDRKLFSELAQAFLRSGATVEA
jgi:hypothetical protein